ncbi:MAG: hypothetical protein QHH17_08150 [Candidatus Bathyarchaeota archaeon]|nr:hypothetical protein [Candidatus Bathyarchaeota archaeon]
MKIGKNKILALNLALLLSLPIIAMAAPTVNADEIEDIQELPVQTIPNWRDVWYKFETPLITLIFPASGKKPMFLWWYTNDNKTIYVVKFKGVIEYLTFDLPYYDRRYHADNLTIQQLLTDKYIEPKLGGFQYQWRQQLRDAIMEKLLLGLIGFHSPYLPFSACTWELKGPELVSKDDVSYWSFNFTLKNVPMWRLEFAENNIQIRCRFYNTSVTEEFDSEHSYTVAAGQLKFDFVVGNWEWNIDKLKDFIDWLKTYQNLNITIPSYKTGLALWINMASIKLEDIGAAENEVQSQYQETVETQSQMRAVNINDEYYTISENKTQNEYEHQVRVTSRFRNCVRVQYANVEGNISGFLEFVPWARLLNETGDTVDYVNVTASYIAAGAHLRLFICYPYFGDYTLEHDPTIGLASAPTLPTLTGRMMLAILIGATLVIAVAVAAVRMRKKPVNIVNIY